MSAILKLHKTLAMKNTFIQDKLKPQTPLLKSWISVNRLSNNPAQFYSVFYINLIYNKFTYLLRSFFVNRLFK